MKNNMYDENDVLKTKYVFTKSKKRAILNNNIERVDSHIDFGKGSVFKSTSYF